MFCPRCGAPREEGARFCPACGADLSGADAPKRPKQSWRSRLAGLVGNTRKARLVTLATVLAVAVAVVAFIAIEPDESSEEAQIPRDAYTIAADRICIQAKREIAASERESLRAGPSAEPGAFAQALVPIVIGWRSHFEDLQVPSDRVELARTLNTALREVEVEIAALARVAQEGDKAETVARAQQVDEGTSRVETAVADLGLDRCARLRLGSTPAASG